MAYWLAIFRLYTTVCITRSVFATHLKEAGPCNSWPSCLVQSSVAKLQPKACLGCYGSTDEGPTTCTLDDRLCLSIKLSWMDHLEMDDRLWENGCWKDGAGDVVAWLWPWVVMMMMMMMVRCRTQGEGIRPFIATWLIRIGMDLMWAWF